MYQLGFGEYISQGSPEKQNKPIESTSLSLSLSLSMRCWDLLQELVHAIMIAEKSHDLPAVCKLETQENQLCNWIRIWRPKN